MLLRDGGGCAKFETSQTFSYVQTDATTPNNVASICKMPKGTKVSHRCVGDREGGGGVGGGRFGAANV